MTTYTQQISAGINDASEAQNGTGFSSTAAQVRCDSNTAAGSRFKGGFRFTGVTIPPGSTISSAVLKVYPNALATDDPNLDIYLEDVDNANNFSVQPDVQDRPLTSAAAGWVDTGLGTGQVTSPDFALSVQEVIDRTGWASSNAMCVIMVGRSDSNLSFRPESYDGVPAEAATLVIDYIAPPTPPTPPPTLTPAIPGQIFQSRRLTLLAYQPTISSYTPAGVFQGEFGKKVEKWQHELLANGGYGSATFDIKDTLPKIEDWIENGLGRHIECYSPEGQLIYEGIVNKLSAHIAGLSLDRGPLMDTGNRVSVLYAPILDPTAIPPLIGPNTSTIIAEDASSQAKYGIIEKVLQGGTVEDSIAEQIRDTWLEENKEPETNSSFDPSGSDHPSVTLSCQGYRVWLENYIYNQTTTSTTTTISAKLQAILTASPNTGLFSTDYGDIATNALLAPSYENENRDAWTIIQELVAQGDVNDDRYLFGIYAGRKAKYNAIPTTIDYRMRLFDQRRVITEAGAIVEPWNLQAGKFLSFDDLLIGRNIPTSLRQDPRVLFIESVTFTAPHGFTLQGGKTSKLSQKLAKLGLGGVSA